MKQLLNFLTLGVKDLHQMKLFYQEKFGWSILKDENEIVFFKLNGFILSLFPTDELAEDIGIENASSIFKGFSLAINFNSKHEVDKAFDELKDKGVRIVKKPQNAFWGGYSGYISDPENNYWELAYNPFLELDNDGNAIFHR